MRILFSSSPSSLILFCSSLISPTVLVLNCANFCAYIKWYRRVGSLPSSPQFLDDHASPSAERRDDRSSSISIYRNIQATILDDGRLVSATTQLQFPGDYHERTTDSWRKFLSVQRQDYWKESPFNGANSKNGDNAARIGLLICCHDRSKQSTITDDMSAIERALDRSGGGGGGTTTKDFLHERPQPT